MCGVAGIVDYDTRDNYVPTVTSMLQSISYRGPDESGIYHSPVATLGNVRLSILDLTTGQQPLSDTIGRYWIVFNGEIFNFRELATELKLKGIQLKTHSDTEVVVNLYALMGSECLQKLNGQFVIAIWDKVKKELFLARDRVGVRPLYYHRKDAALSFASEIKALFSNTKIERELVPENLAQVYTFWTTITPSTPFKDIYELPPGHYMYFNSKGIRTERYWQLTIEPKTSSLSVDEAGEKLDELLTDAVRIRLRADVEVAAYLSGGLDSTAIVSYIKNIEPGILNTFSIGFSEKDYDESSHQQEAVKYFDTNHKSVNCTPSDIALVFPSVVWHSEMPLLRTAPAPMMILSKLARDNKIKVVITGEGSDEILAGYDIFREAKIREFWSRQPDSLLRPLLLKKIYPDIPHLRNASPGILRMFFGYRLMDTDNPFYSHLLRWNNSNHITKHLSGAMKSVINVSSPLKEAEKLLPDGFSEWDRLSKAQWIETTIFMSGYLLSSQGDRMAMANSVEGRYPFLDHRVIEFCSTLPPEYKLKQLNEKYLLKKIVKNRIPESIIKRPKQPYRAPIKSVFLSDKKPDYVEEMLSKEISLRAGIFDYNSFSHVFKRIETSEVVSEMDNMLLTSVISTHLLYRQFIENQNSEYNRPPLNNLKIIEEI